MSKSVTVVNQLLSELPFKDVLTWTTFQTFCTDVLYNLHGITDARDYLGQGSMQDGIDCYAIGGAGERLISAQCKLEKYLAPKAVDDLVNLFIAGDFASRSHEFILCTNFDLGLHRDHERHLQSLRDKLSQNDIKFKVWDYKGLSTQLRNHPAPHIVYRYFGPVVALAFYGDAYKTWFRSVQRVQKPDYPVDPNYISRNLVTYQDHWQNNDNPSYPYLDNRHFEFISLIAKPPQSRKKRFLLMSTAGFGKTVELEHLAAYFAHPKQYLFPIKSYLRDYEGQDINELISLHQPNWRDIEDDALLLILDGLDEVRENYFQTFINHLNQFAEAKPKTTVVVSTRYNFYDLVIHPLRGFEILILQSFGKADIEYYLDKHISSQKDAFLLKIKKSGFLEFLETPYYLARLVRFYGVPPDSFPTTRADLFQRILFERFDVDNRRKGDILLGSEFLQLTRQIAFALTRLGRSAISADEMIELLGGTQQIRTIQNFFLLNKHDAAPDAWSFEHKNLQEYLCATVLESLSLAKIRELVTYTYDRGKVEPRFVNTLSFLFMIGDINGSLYKGLLEWLTTEQEELLVRFEKDRLSPSVRLELFKKILSQYRNQDKALYSSSSFSLEELMDFINLDHTMIDYLEQEMMNDSTGWYAFNGADLLAHFRRPYIYAVPLMKLILQLLERSFDDQIKVNALQALAQLKIIDQKFFEKIFLLPLNLDLPDIRQSMIQLLHGQPFLEDYTDFLINSLAFFEHQENHLNHIGTVELVKMILLRVERPVSLRKVLFHALRDADALAIHDDNDARLKAIEFKELLEKASVYFPDDEEIREQVYQFYNGDKPIAVHPEWLNPVLDYFRANGGLAPPFFRIYRENQSSFQIMPLAEEATCDYLIEEYRIGNIKQAQMGIYRNILGNVNPRLFQYFYGALLREYGPAFQIPDIDFNYQAHWNSYMQKNQAMLIDQALYLQELADIFDALELTAITKKDVYDYDNYKLRAFRDSIALEFLRRESDKIPLDIIYFKNLIIVDDQWKWHKIEEIYRLYDRKVTTGERFIHANLLEFAIAWLQEKVCAFDFINAVKDSDTGGMTYNRPVEFFCRLFLRINPEMSDQELLKILPADFHGSVDSPDLGVAAVIVSKVKDKALLRTTVIEYLHLGLATYVQRTLFWLCHQLHYVECIPMLYRFIRENRHLTGYHRCGLTGHYLALGGDIHDFIEMLVPPPYAVLTNDISWEWYLLDQFIKVEPMHVAELMLEILADDKRDPYHQMTAMHNLISLGRIEGLKFWAERSIDLCASPFKNIIDPIRPHILEMEVDAVLDNLFSVLRSFIKRDAQVERRRTREVMSDFIIDLLVLIVKNTPDTYVRIHKELSLLSETLENSKALYWLKRYIEEITQIYQVVSHPEPTISDIRRELAALFGNE